MKLHTVPDSILLQTRDKLSTWRAGFIRQAKSKLTAEIKTRKLDKQGVINFVRRVMRPLIGEMYWGNMTTNVRLSPDSSRCHDLSAYLTATV